MMDCDIVELQIDDLLITVDYETANRLENDAHYRMKYMAAVRNQLDYTPKTSGQSKEQTDEFASISTTENKVCKEQLPVWITSKNQTAHDQKATLLFLSLRQKYSKQFDDKQTNKNSIWLKIANEMNKQNCFVGHGMEGREKCRQKFANLQASYVRYIDKRRQTGAGNVPKPPFFDELSEILGDKHTIKPVLILDSLKNKCETDTMLTTNQEESNQSTNNNISISTNNNVTVLPSASTLDSTIQNKFLNVKSSVRPDKNQLLHRFVEISEENLETNKRNFKQMMTFLNDEGERRRIQMMALIEKFNPTNKKRKRDETDDSD